MIHTKLSQPATKVDAPHELNTMRYSRTLDQRNPYSRSGSAWIVPMQEPSYTVPDWCVALIGVGVLVAMAWGAL